MAGEIESLDQDEPLERRMARHAYDRLLMLSDGVFAIALTLLALELRPPEQWDGSLHDLTAQRWAAFSAFGSGFGIIGGFWIAHRRLYAQLRSVDGFVTGLSLLLLALVSATPFIASLMTQHGPAKGLPLYMALVFAISFTQASIYGYAGFRADLLDRSICVEERRLRTVQLVIPMLLALAYSLVRTASPALSGLALVPFLVIAAVAKRRETRLRAHSAGLR